MNVSCCATCCSFDPDCARLEHTFAGLAALSSALAATRAQDGHCTHHQRLVTREAACSEHTKK